MSTWHWVIILTIGYVVYKNFKGQTHQPEHLPRDNSVHQWPALNQFDFEIVGESNYQPTIERIAKTGVGPYTATIQLENKNPHDPKAVRVLIDGYTVGFMARETARQYRRRLASMGIRSDTSTCAAQIYGGDTKADGTHKMRGVWLDIKPFD